MSNQAEFIKPGLQNFPLITNIYDYVPLPIVTFADPAVGCQNNPNSCRLVRDVTKQAPTFAENPLCFTLPDQAEIVDVFVAAMRGTVTWNQISCIKTKPNPTENTGNKLGRTSYHNKIWRFFCPCAGTPRKANVTASPATAPPNRAFNTTINKDGSINIHSRNFKAVQTVTTTYKGSTKHTVVTTEVTGEPATPVPNNTQH